MNGRGPAIFTVTFTVVLLALGAGFLVFRTYTPPTSAAPPIVPEVRQFTLHLHAVEAGDKTLHHWLPATIVVNVGDTVILRVTNTDPETAHGFALAAFNIAAPPIPPGGTQTFRFQAARPGVFHFGCSVEGCAADHADQTGQLVVLGHP
jgi:heme/copper-type cytochrome/quinol oxidase subunit 2